MDLDDKELKATRVMNGTDRIFCETCGEEIEFGDEYAEIEIGACNHYIHEKCVDRFWDITKFTSTFYKVRGKEED